MSTTKRIMKLIESLDTKDSSIIEEFEALLLDFDKKVSNMDSYSDFQKSREQINKSAQKVINILDPEGDEGIKLNVDYIDSYLSSILNIKNISAIVTVYDILNESFDKHSKLKFSESYKEIQDIFSEVWIPLENMFKISIKKDLDYSNRLVEAITSLLNYSDLLIKLKVLSNLDVDNLKTSVKFLSNLDKKIKSDIKNLKEIISDLKGLL